MTERKFTHPNEAPEGHRWKTIDGREATQLTVFDAPESPNRIVGVVSRIIRAWDENGSYYLPGDQLDLCDAPVEYTLWLNIYPMGIVYSYQTRIEADECSMDDRIARVKVTYEKGQLDD